MCILLTWLSFVFFKKPARKKANKQGIIHILKDRLLAPQSKFEAVKYNAEHVIYLKEFLLLEDSSPPDSHEQPPPAGGGGEGSSSGSDVNSDNEAER